MRLSFYFYPVAAIVQLVAAGPFTLLYWADVLCTNRRLGCYHLKSLDCCDAPPGRSVFKSTKGYSSGPPALLIFTTPTRTGGCGRCTFTGSLNVCYYNDPWETMYAAEISLCQRDTMKYEVSTEKQPAAMAVKECNGTVPLNFAAVGEVRYDISGPDRDAIIAHLSDINDDEVFARKWAHRSLGPVDAFLLE